MKNLFFYLIKFTSIVLLVFNRGLFEYSILHNSHYEWFYIYIFILTLSHIYSLSALFGVI